MRWESSDSQIHQIASNMYRIPVSGIVNLLYTGSKIRIRIEVKCTCFFNFQINPHRTALLCGGSTVIYGHVYDNFSKAYDRVELKAAPIIFCCCYAVAEILGSVIECGSRPLRHVYSESSAKLSTVSPYPAFV